MRSTLAEFLILTEDLTAFVKSIDPVNAVLSENKEISIRKYLTLRKTLDYSAFIISLYSGFEQYVEDIIWAYSNLLSEAKGYYELPEKLQEKHLRESADLINKPRLGEGRYAGISAIEIIRNLHLCLSESIPFKLNKHAIISHDTNLKAETVQALFNGIGIENINQRAKHRQTLLDWYNTIHGDGGPSIQELSDTVIASRLEDLVTRRNQLTHNGGKAIETLAASELLEWIGFFESYCKSLFEILSCTYLDIVQLQNKDKAIELPKFIQGPIRGNTIVLPKFEADIFVGQPAFVMQDKNVERIGIIEEIQLDDHSVESALATEQPDEIGLRFSFKISKKNKIFIILDSMPAIWE